MGITNLTVKDTGALKVFRTLKMTISGGVHEEQGQDVHQNGPLTVVEVAEVNEFGSSVAHIPSRPWLRGWADGPKAKKIVAAIRTAMQTMAKTQNYAPAEFEAITEQVMTSIRDQFLSGMLRPFNAPLTLKKKAPETRPLVETTQLAHAVHGRLEARDDSGAINWKSEAL